MSVTQALKSGGVKASKSGIGLLFGKMEDRGEHTCTMVLPPQKHKREQTLPRRSYGSRINGLRGSILKAPDPFEMLYTARWNVPRAAEAMGLPACEASWEEVKEQFRQWAVSRTLPEGW